MITTDFIWMNGKQIPWAEANVHVLTHTLHYGAGAFEGIRAYKTDKGPAIFRLQEHVDRLFYSSEAVKLAIPFSKQQIFDAICETIKVNKLEQGYVRPLVYYGYGVMGLNTKGAPTDVAIACWPWGKYLAHDMVDIKISDFIRIHPRSTISDAKICGHYVNSIMASLEVRGTEYHEALFLDYEGNVAEGPGENFFMVKDGKLHTPSLGPILAGITRSTIIEIANNKGYEVIERKIKPDEILAADEAFFTGTAAEVTPIRSISKTVLKSGDTVGPISKVIQTAYADIVYGRDPEYSKYLTVVKI